MKKIFIFIVIIIFFIIGIKLGDTNYNQNQIFEEEKQQFEQEITSPDGHYENKDLVPPKNIINKTANFIDEAIEKAINKLKDILKKI